MTTYTSKRACNKHANLFHREISKDCKSERNIVAAVDFFLLLVRVLSDIIRS